MPGYRDAAPVHKSAHRGGGAVTVRRTGEAAPVGATSLPIVNQPTDKVFKQASSTVRCVFTFVS